MKSKVAGLTILSLLSASCATGDAPPSPEAADEDNVVDSSNEDLPEQVDPDRVVAEKARVTRDPEVYFAFVHDISPPLRDMAPVENEGETEHEAEPLRRLPRPAATEQPSPDRVAQDRPVSGAQIPAPIASFDGLGSGTNGFTVVSAPPDTDGDVGPSHYVQIVNSGYTVFNKTGTRVFGPVNTNTIWRGFGGGCETTNDGDGVVRYDRLANRWVISQFSVNGGNGPFFQCIAVSTTGDPTGSFARYSFPFTAFNDYPKVALWPDAYYFSFNMFPNLQFAGSKVCAVDRAKMLTGANATIQCFDTTMDYGGLLVADLDGAAVPPAGSPAYVVSLGKSNDDLAFWKLHIDFTTPGQSSFLGPSAITVAAYTALCAGQQSCVPQPGAFSQLDGLDDRLMNRVVYRNFGDHEAVILSHAVQRTGGGGGMRWYELRNLSSSPTVFQQGTYAPDGAVRWMGSVAFDKMGDIGLGFSISSSTIKPSIAYTARVPADAAGTMGQGEATLQAGGGSQSGFSFLTRWGDYSSLNIDPTDDCTFWFTQEYLKATGEFNWQTRIGSFKLPGCTAGGGDTTAPATAITAPAAGAQVSGTTTITASASDNVAVTRVELYVDAGLVATVSAPPYSAAWDTRGTPDGSHNLTSKAFDAAGNAGTSAAVAVTVRNGGGGDTTPPTTALTSPSAGATLTGLAALAASASDNVGVTKVEFYFGATLIAADTSSPFSATWDTTRVADGSYSLTSKAYDAAGNSGSSAVVSVTVRNGITGTQLITNGGFETGNLTGWTTAGRVAATTAHHASGSYSARIGSTLPYNGNSTITQAFDVPAAGTTTLTFRYLLRCEKDTIAFAQQQAFILDAQDRVLKQIFSLCQYTTTWTGAQVDLTPYKGQRVKVQFKAHDDGAAADPVWFYADKVSAVNVP